MGLYSTVIAPRLVDIACGPKALDKWRRPVVEGLSGVVLEIGVGGGRNLHLYPAEVTEIWGVEPSPVMRAVANKRARSLGREINWVGDDAQTLDVPAGSVDFVVSTFTACTIPDPTVALQKAKLALKAGGELRCVEHGIAPDESVRRWQRRLQPLHIHLADGCHLLRNPGDIVRAAGFTETQRFEKYPLPYQKWMYFTSLRAVPTEV